MHISCHYICFRDAFMYVLHKVFFVTWKQIAENPQTPKPPKSSSQFSIML